MTETTTAGERHGQDADERPLSIGELAKRTGVSQRTIRYYEELGVFPAPPRTEGGTRRYPKEYIFFIEGAKALRQRGFSLDEIVELGHWAFSARKVSKRTQKLLEAQLEDLEYRIQVLQRVHKLLSQAMAGETRKVHPSESLLYQLGSDPGVLGEAPGVD